MWYFEYLVNALPGLVVIVHIILVIAFLIEHIRRYKRVSNKADKFCKNIYKNPDTEKQSVKQFLSFELELRRKNWFFAGFGGYNFLLIIFYMVNAANQIGIIYFIAGDIEPSLLHIAVEEFTITSNSLLWIVFICGISHIVFSIWRSRILYRAKDALFSIIQVISA